MDFDIDHDTLQLVGFDITAEAVEASAVLQGRKTVLMLGEDDSITLDRVTDVTGLADAIEVL